MHARSVAINLSIAVAMALTTTVAFAKEDGPNLSDAKPSESSASVQAVQTIATAHNLIDHGDANRDALSLVVAARLLKGAGSRPGDAQREAQDDDGEATKAGDDRLAVSAVLARARTYAGERQDIVALIDDVAEGGTRGAITGPSRWTEIVRTRNTDRYRINFRAGETAAVAISGDGDSDLDLYIYDQSGNLICKDIATTDDAYCSWTPRWTGEFIIDIKNLGIINQYVIAHN